ncbi:hypothetical protein V8F33_010694 [Rhypophila sp. PSN 637]
MIASPKVALLGAAAAILPSSVLAATTPFLDICSVEGVLEYFSCLRPVPEGCVESLEEQANAFCSSYLFVRPQTTYLSTVTPEVPIAIETVIVSTTVYNTFTEVVATTVEETSTTVETVIAPETTTTTITAVSPAKRALTPSAASQATPACPNLTQRHLENKPAWKLSKACSCLAPQPTTVTLDATTLSASVPGETVTVTEPATATVVVSKTDIQTSTSTTTLTETTTTISTAIATETVQPPKLPRCSLRYTASGNGIGNVARLVTANSWDLCCEMCGTTPNCVAGAYSGGSSCQLLVKQVSLTGAPTTESCPLGQEQYRFGNPNTNGVVFAGPCGVV